MSDNPPHTLARWRGVHGNMHRIQASPVPGSAHWNIVMDVKTDGEWQRRWSKEASNRPKFEGSLSESDADGKTVFELTYE